MRCCATCCARCACSATGASRSARSRGRAPAAKTPGAPSRWARADAAHGMLVIAPEQEDELRAFCSLVSRRAPHGNELAWALRRFELGCERAHPYEALSDHLLALRALLEPEGPSSGLLAGRIAALCATPEDRAELTERMTKAQKLERAVIAGQRRRAHRRHGDRARRRRPSAGAAAGRDLRPSHPRSGAPCGRAAGGLGAEPPVEQAPSPSRPSASTPAESMPTSSAAPVLGSTAAGPRRRRSRGAVSPAGGAAMRASPARSWMSSSRYGTTTGALSPSSSPSRLTVAASRRASTSKSARFAATRAASRSPSSPSSSSRPARPCARAAPRGGRG